MKLFTLWYEYLGAETCVTTPSKHRSNNMGSVDADTLATIKLIQPVVSGLGTVVVGAGAALGLVGAVAGLAALS